MVEELLERFSAVVSDVCACLMGFGPSGPFLEEKIYLAANQLTIILTAIAQICVIYLCDLIFTAN